LACAPGELHEGSLLMLGVLLRRLRWPVLYLGQAMPLSDLSLFLDDLNPSVVVFVAMCAEAAHMLIAWPQHMPEVAAHESPFVCFGGQAFVDDPSLIEQMRGLYLGDTLPEGIQKLNMTLHRLNPLLYKVQRDKVHQDKAQQDKVQQE
jgi:MerR family transcriptional regulator, light-induced transcriptional regulator